MSRARIRTPLYDLLMAMVLLLLALASKVYRGPYWQFSNAYVGDIFIVGTLYFILSFAAPGFPPIKKAFTIGMIAVAVELFQATGIPASWGLPEPFSFVLGTSFDPRDFMFYGVGLIVAIILDRWMSRKLL